MTTQRQVIKSEHGAGVGEAQELQEIVAENGSKKTIIDESVTSSRANNLCYTESISAIRALREPNPWAFDTRRHLHRSLAPMYRCEMLVAFEQTTVFHVTS